MCTCNGANYLPDQLDSILNQSRLPDELVMIDDASDDATPCILKKYARKFDIECHIYRNNERLGSTQNFVKAIQLCQSDIIALCDQDDVWLPEKLARIEDHFVNYPETGYVFSDGLLVDEKLKSKHRSLWQYFQFSEKMRNKFRDGYLNQIEILLRKDFITGATLAINNRLKSYILPIPAHWVHDAWIVLLLSALGYPGAFIEEKLIQYRIHSQQQIGLGIPGEDGVWGKIQKTVQMDVDPYEVKYKRLKSMMELLNRSGRLPEDTMALFKQKLSHIRNRQHLHNLPCWRRIPGVLRGLKRKDYHRFSNGWQSVGKDLFL